jgi:hypothetical protein
MAESNCGMNGMSGTFYIQTVEGNKTEKLGEFSNLTFTTDFTEEFPKVKRVEFHNKKATVVYFDDGTVERCVVGEKDIFSPEYGYAMCLAKKFMGSYEKFAWSLDKAKHYENGKKVKKTKTALKAGITIEEIGENLKKLNKLR